MPEAQSGLTRTAAHLHNAMKAAADGVGILLVDGFHKDNTDAAEIFAEAEL